MASWQHFSTAAPEIAASAGRLLDAHSGLVYLATVRANGTPQVHPVVLYRAEGRAWMFIVEVTAKYADLVCSGRFALHTLPDAGPEHVDIHLEGRALPCADVDLRAAVARASGNAKPPWELLFEADIDRATLVVWERWGTPQARPSFARWREE